MASEDKFTASQENRQGAYTEIRQIYSPDSQSKSILTGEQLVEHIIDGREFQASLLLNDMYYLKELPNGEFYIGIRMEGMADHVEALRIIQKLIEFYATVSPNAISEFAEILDENERQLRKSNIRTGPSPRIKRGGFVYLLKSPTGYYKIGRTKNPRNRRETFSVKLPFEVEFEHLIKTDDMETLELELHGRFSDRRVNGEWFSLSTEDVAYIKSIGDVS